MDIHIWFLSKYFAGHLICKLELIWLNVNIAIVSTLLNGFNYCSQTLIILFIIIIIMFSAGFLVDFWNAVPTVVLFLVGLQLSILLWLCSSFYLLHLLFARLSWIVYLPPSLNSYLSDFVCILPVLLDIFLLIDIVPFLVFGHLCLLSSSDSFWRQFSRVRVFL